MCACTLDMCTKLLLIYLLTSLRTEHLVVERIPPPYNLCTPSQLRM